MTRRIATLIAAAAVLWIALALGGCGGTGSQSFEDPDHALSFDFPSGWTLTHDQPGSGGTQRSITVALRPPFDQIEVSTYKLKKKLPDGVNGYKPEVARIVGRLTSRAGSEASRPRVVKYGGKPGFAYVLTYGAAGQKLKNRLTLLFAGQTLTEISCQSSAENRDQVEDACGKVLNSLEFD
jgi:hypothetical protein